MDKTEKNMFSRRQDDPRQEWSKDRTSNDDALVIPPCDLWHSDETKPELITPILASEGATREEKDSILKENTSTTSQCWAFMGSVGGVGTTTFAVQIAHELAKLNSSASKKLHRAAQPQVCLIDLDFEAGSCMHHLDVAPSLSLDDLTGEAIRIDTTLAQALLSTHDSGISVLAAQNVMGANSRVNPATVLALLDAASELFPYVIIDLPRHWYSWSEAVLHGSDFVGLLSDLTIPSLHMARSKREQLVKMFDSEDVCQVILNKYERRSFNNTLRLSDAQIALQCEIFGTLCVDEKTTREALNCGEPVGAILGDSRYSKDSRKLLKQIVEITKLNTENNTHSAHIAA